MNVYVMLNVTLDHLEVSETVLSYAMAIVKREQSQKKKSKLITQARFHPVYCLCLTEIIGHNYRT